MKATILQSNFAKALNFVSRVVSNRTTLPVLNNVLIEAKDGKLKMSATDLEIAITVKMVGKVDQDGLITVPARLLSDFVLNNKDKSIDIVLNKLNLNLKSERFEANIKGIDAEEFPTIPSSKQKSQTSIKVTDLSEALRKVAFSAAGDDTRPVLAGVLLKFSDKDIILAATDSYRLAEKKIQTEKKIDDREIVVPARTLNELNRILSSIEMDGVVDVIIDETQIFFNVADIKLVSRLIEGSFPNYSQIIPEASKITVKADIAELLNALKISAIFAKDSANNIKVEIKNKELIIKSGVGENGDTTSKINAVSEGGNLEIAFNARYLIDVMNILNGKEVIMKFNDDSSPCIITCDKDEDYLYLAMPLKTDS